MWVSEKMPPTALIVTSTGPLPVFGVPEIAPVVGLIDIQAGALSSDQVYGLIPPVAVGAAA